MKFSIRSLMVVAVLILRAAIPDSANAKEYTWRAAPQDGIIEYHNGAPIVRRIRNDYAIVVTPSNGGFFGRPGISLYFGNISRPPFTVGIENLSIRFEGERSQTTFLSQRDLVNVVKNKAGFSSFATAFLGGTTTSQTTVSTPYGRYTARSSNPSQDYGRIDAAASSVIDLIQNRALNMTTIKAGEIYDTAAFMNKPDVRKFPTRATLTIKIDDIEEVFLFDVSDR